VAAERNIKNAAGNELNLISEFSPDRGQSGQASLPYVFIRRNNNEVISVADIVQISLLEDMAADLSRRVTEMRAFL
jgi:hypothetical protein